MKSIYSRLHVFLVVLFVLGAGFSAFKLFSLPKALQLASARIDFNVIEKLKPVLLQANLTVGFTLVLGIATVIFSLYLISTAKAVEKIVYVEKKASQKDNKEKERLATEGKSLQDSLIEIKAKALAEKDHKIRCEKLLSVLCNKIEASQGILYLAKKEKNQRLIELYAAYAFSLPDSETLTYKFGEGLAGQAAKEGKKLNITDVPEGYITVISGLGKATPGHLLILPLMESGETVALVEVASFKAIGAR